MNPEFAVFAASAPAVLVTWGASARTHTQRPEAAAAMAFLLGLMAAFAEECPNIEERMRFDDAKSNFFAAARHGLNAQLTWLDREVLQRAIEDEQSRVGFSAMLPGLLEHLDQIEQAPARPLPEDTLWHILGDASDGPNARTG